MSVQHFVATADGWSAQITPHPLVGYSISYTRGFARRRGGVGCWALTFFGATERALRVCRRMNRRDRIRDLSMRVTP